MAVKKLGPDEWQKQATASGTVIIDVRTPDEFKEDHIVGAVNMDYLSDEIMELIEEMNKETAYAIYCKGGMRSGQVAEQMIKTGIKNVYDLEGGILAWIKAGKEVVK